MSKYIIVRVKNARKFEIMDVFFNGIEYEQVESDTDIWFEGRRGAKKAVKELSSLGFDAEILDCEIKLI